MAAKVSRRVATALGGDLGARPFFQTPFDKMLEFPQVEFFVEALLKSDAGVVTVFGAGDL